jgi:hypothetical protein
MEMSAPGRHADTGIEADYQNAVDEAKAKGCPPPTQCEFLETNGSKYRLDQLIPTAKTWGCKGSRWQKGGKKR